MNDKTMIALELAFNDDPRRLDARPAHRAHLARLHEQGVLVMAGPWADESGALLVFRADEAALDEIMSTDPYYSTPGVSVVAKRAWNPIVGA